VARRLRVISKGGWELYQSELGTMEELLPDRSLQDAACPLLPFSDAMVVQYVSWLVAHAMSQSYEDRAAETKVAASSELLARAGSTSATLPSAEQPPQEVSPAVSDAIASLAITLNVPVPAGDHTPLQVLRLVHRAVRLRVLPALVSIGEGETAPHSPRNSATERTASCSALTEAASDPSALVQRPALPRRSGAKAGKTAITAPSPAASELLNLSTFPLGFTTHDQATDQASAILRMLYLLDLRELQDSVNDILVLVQEFTANPRTDSALGQVGR
jgi:RLL motif containing protein 1